MSEPTTAPGDPSGEVPLGVAPRRIGRYALLDLVAEDGDVRLWRGYDETLDRPVGIRSLPVTDPRARTVHAAACAAAAVDDRRLVRVLDVLETDDRVGIVTEWVPGRTLADVLREESLSPAEAVSIAREVGWAVEAAASQGVHHGHLRPSSVLVSDVGEVRVRGLAVDAALWGTLPPGHDGPLLESADVHGIGAVLYAGLTGRWPAAGVDGLPPAPRVGERVLEPSRVVADVPAVLDDVVARSVEGVAPPRGRVACATVPELVSALGLAADQLPTRSAGTRPPRRPRRWLRWVGRTLALVLILALVAGLLLLGWRLISGGPSPWGPPAGAIPSGVLTATAGPRPTLAGVPGGVGDTRLDPLSITDFDPYGDDGTENSELAELAIDKDPVSAWTTVRYRTADLSGKPGTGLLLDLGSPRPVSSVELGLVGNGTDVEVRVANQQLEDPADWPLLASAAGAGEEITLRAPRPVTGRYVLVWITRLPLVDGSYQGGVRDVVVRG